MRRSRSRSASVDSAECPITNQPSPCESLTPVRMRVISSLLVVVVGLVPCSWAVRSALLMTLLGVVGYREYLELVAKVNPSATGTYAQIGYAVVLRFGCAPLFEESATSLLLITFLAVVSPLVLLFPRATQPGGFSGWSLGMCRFTVSWSSDLLGRRYSVQFWNNRRAVAIRSGSSPCW